MRYYLRPSPRTPLFFSDGTRVPVEIIGGSWGLIAVEDATQIRELDLRAKEKRGLQNLTAEGYAEFKKKFPPGIAPKRNPLREIRLFNAEVELFAQPAVAAASPPPVVVQVDAPHAGEPATGEPLKPFAPRKARAKRA